MKVILDIPQENLDRFGELAKICRQSRKAYMEQLLIGHSPNKPIAAAQINLGVSEQPEEVDKPAFGKKTAIAAKFGRVKDVQAGQGVQDLNVPPKSNYSIDTRTKDEIEQRIKELTAEMKSPPKNPLIGLRKWTAIREQELNELKNKL